MTWVEIWSGSGRCLEVLLFPQGCSRLYLMYPFHHQSQPCQGLADPKPNAVRPHCAAVLSCCRASVPYMQPPSHPSIPFPSIPLSISNPIISYPTPSHPSIGSDRQDVESQTQPIQTQTSSTPPPPHNPKFKIPLLARLRPSSNIPFLCPQHISKALTATI